MKEFIDKLIGRLEEQKTRYREIRKNTYCRRAEMDDCDSCRADHYLDARLEGINKAKEIVNKLAEEYKLFGNSEQVKVSEMPTGWIPVSERLPEISNWYLVTVAEPHETFMLYFDTYDNDWTDFDCRTINNVIAWQPLPAPYTEGE